MPKFRLILSAINIYGYKIAQFLIPILEPPTHNEFTIKDSFSFGKETTTQHSSVFMASLDVESLFTNIPLNGANNNCVSDLHNKNLYDEKLMHRDPLKLIDKTISESPLIVLFINKLTGWQWVLPWVPPLQMHFSAIMKKGWIIVQFNLNL